MKNKEIKDFTLYEYLSLNVDSEKELLYIDCYESFGWVLVNNSVFVDKNDYYINSFYINKRTVNIKFKRDRKIKNKSKLLDLQNKLEYSLKELSRLEEDANTSALITSMTIGLIGTVFMALSVFSFTAKNPLYILFVICGLIGIVGWTLPYFVYKKVKHDKENENASLIEKEYDNIYEICEKANRLSKN